MIDRFALVLLRPIFERAAVVLAARGITADQATLTGFGFGMAVPLLINRALDGLDGALARRTAATERGAFLDIALDFLFYAAIPLAFAFCNPAQNALAGAVLLAAFVGTGSSFLAFAIIAEKRGLKSTAYPSKSFYYLGGLTEGAETILCFLAMCLWPPYFQVIAYVYAALCTITTVTRLLAGWTTFGGDVRS